MGVPGWLLNLVMGFLTDRELKVRYKGCTTSAKPLPGGGPQGSLLGGFLFLILINLCGFKNQELNVGETICNERRRFKPQTLHAKFVDDLTIMEAINLDKSLVYNPVRPLPDSYHERTGHKLLPEKSLVYKQIQEIQDYAIENEMNVNYNKTKFLVFSRSRKYDFLPEYNFGENEVNRVETIRLLGINLRTDLKWTDNTAEITKKAYARMWTIRRLKPLGATNDDLRDVFVKQVRSVLEFGVPVWNSNLTTQEAHDIERVQKCFLRMIFENLTYEDALDKMKMETLELRRTKLCTNFAQKAANHEKHSHWFKTAPDGSSYQEPYSKKKLFRTSPIPYLTRLLND